MAIAARMECRVTWSAIIWFVDDTSAGVIVVPGERQMSRRSHAAKLRRLVLLVALATMGAERSPIAKNPEKTKRPPPLSSGGQFSGVGLTPPPVIDGRAWIAIE